ncbi:hypothetical protein [Pseudomonas fragariae (ex Marin et al. 2024)]|uniref:hypothetical protein n=1 Tax=Pseudomonas fragariae (ex Marin et al. 2024) TaxID=3080056 RepID=UPI003F7B1257
MNTFSTSIAGIIAWSVVTSCHGDDFIGAYRLQGSNNQRAFVLNVHGKDAELYQLEGKESRVKPLAKMNVSISTGKLFLDDVKGDDRLTLERNVDERSLNCLNCTALGLPNGSIWNFDSRGPYNLPQMLEEQSVKDEAALNAELLASSQKIMEQAQRSSKAAKLGPFEGEWVYQRVTKLDPLSIMTIWQKSQIKQWSFDFQTMDRLSQGTPNFEILENGLKIRTRPQPHLYALSSDKQTLTCVDCATPQRWRKSDPKKDLSDRYYARIMAGNPGK